MNIWNSLRIFSASSYAICIFLYAEKLLLLRIKRRYLYPVVLIISALFAFLAPATLPIPILYLTMLLVLYLILHLFFEGRKIVHAFATGNFIFHMLCIKGIIIAGYSSFFHITMYVAVHDDNINSFLSILLFLIVLLFLIIFQFVYKVEKIKNLINDIRSCKILCSIQIVLNATMIMTSLVYYVEEPSLWLNGYHLLICIMMLVGFYTIFEFFVNEQVSRQRQNNIDQLQKQIEYETKRYQLQTSYITNLRRIKHDYFNQIRGLQYVLEQKGLKEGVTYLNDLKQEFSKTKGIYQKYSDHTLLDAILQEYATRASDKNIQFKAFLQINDIHISDLDLCTLFTNLLNNAIEANEHVLREQRFIEIASRESGRWKVITIKNKYHTIILDNKNRLVTSKQYEKEHGFGIKGIKEIVDQNNGMFQFIPDEKEKTFFVQLMFPMYDPTQS